MTHAVHHTRQTLPRPRSGNQQAFFVSKKAAAVLKHAILGSYIVPFASKAGSRSNGNRVVVIDGYAGAGRYDSGDPGSPTVIAGAARKVANNRRVECYFVEKHGPTYERLCNELKTRSGRNVRWEARHGTIEEHLDSLLVRSANAPLFLFLDPFGLGLSFNTVVNVFARRPTKSPATEVLFRFDANSIRRIRGVLLSAKHNPGRNAQLERLNTAAGGTWWQECGSDNAVENDRFMPWFMDSLLVRLSKKAGCTGWVAEVKQQNDQQAAYYMVFLTRSRDGMDVFAEALSLAQEKWRRAVFNQVFDSRRTQGLESLLSADDLFKQAEDKLAAYMQDQIERNIRALLRDHKSFVVRIQWFDVFATVLGVARQKHLRVALNRLHAAGMTTSDGTGGNLYNKRITRTPSPQP